MLLQITTLLIILANINHKGEASVIRAGCSISINSHLGSPQPLLLKQNNAVTDIDAFPLPVDAEGTLNFNSGEKIDLACPGSNSVILDGFDTKEILVEATCSSGISFTVTGKNIQFDRIRCRTYPLNTARYTKKTCAGKFKEIEVGFNLKTRFIRHLLICFDSVLQNSLWTYTTLSSAIAGQELGHPRPRFNQGNFYNVAPSSLNKLYALTGQRATINKILGLPKGDTSVVQNNNYFLAKGHYSARADFVYGSQQNLTFWFVNAAPQWQTFNAGNWNTMEGDCRNFASDRKLDLQMYTGSHGISTLPDKAGVEKKLYLFEDPKGNQNGIHVPAIYYRVVYDPKNKAGVAFVGLNNPYKTNVQEDVICKDVSDKIKWVTWDAKNLKLGYSYCCEVNDLKKTITTIPNLDVKSLLV